MNVGHIVTGHLNEVLNLKQDISKKRLEICKTCPLFTPKLGGTCNRRLWYNAQTGDVSTVKLDGYVRGCGCRLRAKTTMSRESCPAGKW